MWAAALDGLKKGLTEGPRLFFAPITPRVWLYAVAVSRKRGMARGVPALLCQGPTLLADDRLLPSGKLRRGA